MNLKGRMGQNGRLALHGILFSALVTLAPSAASSQQAGAGGVLLTFSFEQLFETDDNYALSSSASDRTSRADTTLSFSLSSETPSQQISLKGSGALRVSDGPGFGAESRGFVRPSVSFAYNRVGPGSSFDLSARVRETDIEFMRSLADFDDGSGVIILPDDIADLTGTGTRRNIGANMALNWGQDGPLSLGLRAGFDDFRYRNTSSTSLNDYRRMSVGASARMQIDDLWRAVVDFGVSRHDKDDPTSPRRDTTSLSGSLVRDLPRGSISGRLSIDRTEDGNRLGLSFARSLELPGGSLSANIGATRTAVGHHLQMVGGVDLSRDLPRGRLNASLQRSVSTNSDDDERVLTALSLRLLHEVAPDKSISLDLSYVASDTPGSGSDVKTASFGTSYHHEVTPDWGLDLGYRHRRRDESGLPSARSNMVYLSLRRSFQFRP